MPTSSCGGKLKPGRLLEFFRISVSTPGAILQPQPPPCDRLVRRGAAGDLEMSEEVIGRLSRAGHVRQAARLQKEVALASRTGQRASQQVYDKPLFGLRSKKRGAF